MPVKLRYQPEGASDFKKAEAAYLFYAVNLLPKAF